MSKLGDPAKVKEATEELKLGEKAIAKTMFKWKPDWVEGEPHFQRAARAFKSAGLMDSAVDAWRKAANCSYHMGNLKQGAVTLETAGREMSMAKDDKGKTEAARLYAEAAGLLQEASEPVRAADLKLRAAKQVEAFDKDLAMRFVDECIALFDGDSDKDVYAVEPLRKAMQAQLGLGKHASAMRTMDRLWAVWTRLDQKHNLYKLVLSRVILLLAAADPVAAQAEYDSRLDLGGFASADEAAAAEDLLQAYSDADADALTAVLGKHTIFGYIEPAVTRVAKSLPAAIAAGGTKVGSHKAEEAASAAVAHRRPAQGDGGFGAGFRVIGGGGGGSSSSGAGRAEEEEEDLDTRKAQKRAAADAHARASLFAKGPSAGAGAGGGGAGAAAEAEDGGPAMAGFAEGADDVDAAFRDMGLGEGGELEDHGGALDAAAEEAEEAEAARAAAAKAKADAASKAAAAAAVDDLDDLM